MNRAERRRLAKQQKKNTDQTSLGDSSTIDLLFQTALGHQQQGQLDKAEQGYRRVLRTNPDSADAHYNLGTVYLAIGQLGDAEGAFRQTIRLNPNFAGGHFNLGFVLSETGHLDEARAAFRKVIALTPDAAEAHRQLASITKFDSDNDDVKAMEKLYAKPDITKAQRMDVSFGLAKAYEDLGQYPKAFSYLSAGNRLKRANYSYATDQQKVFFDRFRDSFSKPLFDKLGCFGDPNETPIFILGMPRSGTSLVEQILASHPEVYGAGELTALSQVAAETFGRVSEENYKTRVQAFDPKRLAEVGQKYIRILRQHGTEMRFITDKMPHNFLHIGLIKLALPNAKIIHCRRDPMDNCLSIFKTFFPGNVHEYASDLTETGEYYTLYNDLMNHWHAILPGFIYDIHYEKLVADQENQSRALIAHCGLDWNDACLEFYKTKRAVKTASMVQVRNPIYKSSVQSWKRFEKELAPLIKALRL